jgi:hypothetical protein
MLLNPFRFGDPYFANVSSLLPLNGTNGSTTITDVKGKTWSVAGNAAISTAQSKWGGASLALDGTGDYVTTASHADFAVGSGDFDIAGWVYITSTGDRPFFSISSTSAGTPAGFVIFARHTSGSGTCRFFNAATGIGYNGSTVVSLNAWHFVQCRRIGTSLQVAIDNTVEISQTLSTNWSDTGTVLVGASRGPTPTSFMQGYIDDFRFTKGVGRPLILPTGPFETY